MSDKFGINEKRLIEAAKERGGQAQFNRGNVKATTELSCSESASLIHHRKSISWFLSGLRENK